MPLPAKLDWQLAAAHLADEIVLHEGQIGSSPSEPSAQGTDEQSLALYLASRDTDSLIMVRSIAASGHLAIVSNDRRISSVVLTPHEGDAPMPTTPSTVIPASRYCSISRATLRARSQ
jgi:hypothetical protein